VLGDTASTLPGVLDCMHCGLCLEQCATYRDSGAEDRSPRGRLFLMRAVDEGRMTPAEVLPSLSSCLQCRACEPVCPSKVDYHGVLQHYFARVPTQAAPRPSALSWWLDSPTRMRRLAAFARGLRKSGLAALITRFPVASLRQALAAIPQRPQATRWRTAQVFPAHGQPRASISLMRGCLESEWSGEILDQLIALLQQQGVQVHLPPQPACCGAFRGHAGDPSGGRAQAQDMLQALQAPADTDAILIAASGCHAWLHEQDPLGGVQEPLAFLQRLGLRGSCRPLPLRATLQEACHQRNLGEGFAATRTLLAQIPELVLHADPEAELCCGAGGATFLREADQALALGQRKVQQLRAEEPEVLLSANPGCRMQLEAAQARAQARPALPVLHPLQLLYRSCCLQPT